MLSPLLPELEQRGGKQRQRARLALHVVDQCVRQLGLHAQTHPAGGQLDDAPQLRGLHGSDQHVVRTQQLGDSRIGGEPPVEVCPQRDHHHRPTSRISRRTGQRVGERITLGFERQAVNSSSSWSTATRRRSFAGKGAPRASTMGSLALDTSTRRSSSSGRSPGRSSTRRHRSLPGRTLQRGSGEDRRAGPTTCRCPRGRRCPGSCADEARDELGDETIAAEEILGIHRLEARQALERADLLCGHAGRGGRAR